MRFQVQWNTNAGGPTFSQLAPPTGDADPNIGVTVPQAIVALDALIVSVVPRKARLAAMPAWAKQVNWVRSRPPAGVGPGRQTNSVLFDYRNYRDARVDIENLRGHNLRQ